jgi:hypothetical protein
VGVPPCVEVGVININKRLLHAARAVMVFW